MKIVLLYKKDDNNDNNNNNNNKNAYGDIKGKNTFIKETVNENPQLLHDCCDLEDNIKYKMLNQKSKDRIVKIKRKIKKFIKLTKGELKLLSKVLHHKFLLNEISAIGNYEQKTQNNLEILELEEFKLRKDFLNMYCDCLSIEITNHEKEFLKEFQLFMPDVNIMADKNILYVLRHSKNEKNCVFKYFLDVKETSHKNGNIDHL
ncbi:hypothetical protein PFLG_00339 [Plasmodium falciparum RAJ116]|uniref:Uncharacterized protein n=1 Tax=Plasmodium falciparum RAJ116 TaxID=580058 RepID=A0A0L0CWG7_PLAFA|nr:hypothetical protein PFLG_00339 [Plasmodium falciparum RAJ116]